MITFKQKPREGHRIGDFVEGSLVKMLEPKDDEAALWFRHQDAVLMVVFQCPEMESTRVVIFEAGEDMPKPTTIDSTREAFRVFPTFDITLVFPRNQE